MFIYYPPVLGLKRFIDKYNQFKQRLNIFKC